jgi:organic radical activating enzyme
MIVQDQYTSFQGTGLNTGVRQRFVRLAGCSVPCKLRANCDQPEALTKSSWPDISIEQILDGVGNDTQWLHITGGEPLDHLGLPQLVMSAMAVGLRVQVQTSGYRPVEWIGDAVPFLTVSPKTATLYHIPDEYCLISCSWLSFEMALEWVERRIPVFVVPECIDGNPNIPPAIKLAEKLIKCGVDARLSLQAHLVWNLK